MTENATTRPIGRPAYQRLVIVAAAIIAALIAYLFISSSTTLDVRSGGSVLHVGPAAVAFAAALSGFAAWVVLALCERFARRPRRVFTLITVAAFVISLLGPAGGVGAAAVGGLLGLHSVVAALLITGLRRTTR